MKLCYRLLAEGENRDLLEDFPYSDGRLMVVFYASDEINYQFLINAEGIIRLSVEIDGKHELIADHLQAEEALHYLRLHRWLTFATSTYETSARKKAVTSVEKVSTHHQILNGLWSTKIVQNFSAMGCALTEQDFIAGKLSERESPEIPCFSLSSIQNRYRGMGLNNLPRPRGTPAITTLWGQFPNKRVTSGAPLQGQGWLESGFVRNTEPNPQPTTPYAHAVTTSTYFPELSNFISRPIKTESIALHELRLEP